jgi:hypothetical protein
MLLLLTELCLRALFCALESLPPSPACEGKSADFKMPSAFEFRRFVDRKQLPRRPATDCA